MDLAREFGAVSESPTRKPQAVSAPGGAPASPPVSGVDDATRERVLAAVTDALGLGTEDLARVLYGEESPSTKSKARGALDKWRRG